MYGSNKSEKVKCVSDTNVSSFLIELYLLLIIISIINYYCLLLLFISSDINFFTPSVVSESGSDTRCMILLPANF